MDIIIGFFIIIVGFFCAIALFMLGRSAKHIQETTRICPHCGYRMGKKYRACQKCGKESEPEKIKQRRRER